jgi:Lytic polysaccharide mono-oxygenase, cellulose-degrading
MNREQRIAGALMCLMVLCTTHAHAHFKLLKPTSWLTEDELGGPQKGSPCGSGNTRPFIGDDVQPIPASDAVTTFHAGETITVELQETVYHPGYFRISVAPTSAADATSADFPDPPLTDPVDCHYDHAAVQTHPHEDVLADGIFMAAEQNGTNRSLRQEVKLPSEPCESCTLQVVQVMEGHPASSCFYFHCADIKILPASGSAGSGTAGGTAGTSGTGGKTDSGGCSVARAGARSSTAAAWCLLGLASVFYRRRRPR